jgi:hypothetical protein
MIELKNPPGKGGRQTLPLQFDSMETLRTWVSALEIHCATDVQLKEKMLQEEKTRKATEALQMGFTR